MADISKCSGKNCPIKEKCYRFTAQSGIRQSYILPPFEIINNQFKCELFWGEQSESILDKLKDIMR